jgi:hypothetical protein
LWWVEGREVVEWLRVCDKRRVLARTFCTRRTRLVQSDLKVQQQL